jgi:short-subunit dehydrogenase
MLERGSGHIVNIASAAGKVGTGGGATYCATKHAVVGLSEAVRAEARSRGVQISVVMPTVINTELGSGVGATPILGKPEPAEVGTAIADALERPRFEVYVPRALGPIFRVMRLLPRSTQDLALPGAAALDVGGVLRVTPRRWRGRTVLLDPAANGRAVLGLFRGVVEIHVFSEVR